MQIHNDFFLGKSTYKWFPNSCLCILGWREKRFNIKITCEASGFKLRTSISHDKITNAWRLAWLHLHISCFIHFICLCSSFPAPFPSLALFHEQAFHFFCQVQERKSLTLSSLLNSLSLIPSPSLFCWSLLICSALPPSPPSPSCCSVTANVY